MADVVRPFDAVIAGNTAGALEWYEKRRQNLIGQPVQLHDWARLLCSLGRRSEADPLFEHLADNDDYAMFVAGQRFIEALGRGLSLEEALSTTPLGAAARHKEAITAAMAEFDITRRPPETRHIAICGVSFCGSTLMDQLLEGIPGVSSIGESVWLTLSYVEGQPRTRNFSQAHGPGIQECNHCGQACEFLTPNFRNALGLNPVDWYFRIAERLGTKILVSADKNLPKVVLFDPELRLQALVVFKSPKQAWASNYTKMKAGLSPNAYFEAMMKYMGVWKQAYSNLTHVFNPRDGRVFLDFDRFADAPEAKFRSLTRVLDLEYDPGALAQPGPGHSIGGNSNAIRRASAAEYRIEVRPLGEAAIPADHAEWIDNQADLTELHAAMRQLSEDHLARAA
jgi:hypothetical protein